MSKPPRVDNRLETLMENRRQILSEAKVLVETAINQIIANLDDAHGIKVFQTRHLVEALASKEGWQDLAIGEQTLLEIVRGCGYQSVSWKTPGPGSRIVKVWRKSAANEPGGEV